MIELDLDVLSNRPKKAIQLFEIMMRFEFALKDAGYISTFKNGSVKVDWDGFANHGLPAIFFDTVKNSGLAKTLLTKPPSHQRERYGSLGFEDAKSPTDNQLLIGAVCRVRNNLFHGGKSGDKDHDRNDDLVINALYVIKEAIKSNKEVRVRFEGRY